ncbi:hypothetical protein D3C76_1492750 [compost metagenome]
MVGQVGGYRGIGDAQLLDVDLAHDLADLAKHLIAANGAKAKAHVDQAQHIQVIQAFDPVSVFVELASGVDATDHGAHGTAGDAGDVIAASLDFFDHTNVGIAPCTT